MNELEKQQGNSDVDDELSCPYCKNKEEWYNRLAWQNEEMLPDKEDINWGDTDCIEDLDIIICSNCDKKVYLDTDEAGKYFLRKLKDTELEENLTSGICSALEFYHIDISSEGRAKLFDLIKREKLLSSI